jgi:hypothetical protein
MTQLHIPDLKPNSVLVIGDVHGYTKSYQKLIERLPAGQRSVQIGDMGLGFSGVGLHRMPDSHTFFRGNHDSPEKCRAHPNYRGDYGYDAETQIFHLAGAWSIDRAYRTENISWWRDEELNYTELTKAIELYEQTKPKFVLSHEAPVKAVSTLLYDLIGPYFLAKAADANSRTSRALQMMLDAHQPEQWIFGHYHVDKEFYAPGCSTKFRCVGGMMSSGEPPHTYLLEVA